MIRVAVMYPNQSDKRLDFDYYRNSHMPLVKEKYGPYGLQGLEIDEAVSKEGKQSAPYLVVGYMLFDSLEAFFEAYKQAGKEVMSDIGNFTDIEPVVQISQYFKV